MRFAFLFSHNSLLFVLIQSEIRKMVSDLPSMLKENSTIALPSPPPLIPYTHLITLYVHSSSNQLLIFLRIQKWDYQRGDPQTSRFFHAATPTHIYMFLLFREQLMFRKVIDIKGAGWKTLQRELKLSLITHGGPTATDRGWWPGSKLTMCDKDYAKRYQPPLL